MSDAFIWNSSTGTATLLQAPSGGSASPNAIAHDGSVIVGYVITSLGAFEPAKWDSSGNLTLLAPSTGIVSAIACSSDASIIVGSGNLIGCYWSGGGTTAHALSPLMGDVEIDVGGGIAGQNICSDDGSIIVGTSVSNVPTRTAVYWTNGVITSLPNTRGQAFVTAVSNDGSVVAGWNFDFNPPSANDAFPLYWQGGSQFLLTLGSNVSLQATGISGDGTILYTPGTVTQIGLYWDNISTASGGVYGTLHTMSIPSPYTDAGTPAFANLANASTGSAYNGSLDSQHAVRWNGTTPTLLQFLSEWATSQGQAISGDGSVVAGGAILSDTGSQRATVWDVSGNALVLEVPDGYSDTFTVGISRDGSTVFGYANPIPPPPPPGNLQLVTLYPTQEPDDVYALSNNTADFSDTFTQFSLCVWCCQNVTITFGYGSSIAMTPSQCVISLTNAAAEPAFSATFDNPGTAQDEYQVLFSVDTDAQTYTFYVNNIAWTTTDATFPNPGPIGNP